MPKSRANIDLGKDDERLDRVFRALGDGTRRAMLARLTGGAATVSELAAPFDMTLAGVSKHLRVLEDAGLVTRAVHGRVRRCTLKPAPLEHVSTWVAGYRPFWEHTLDALADYMTTK